MIIPRHKVCDLCGKCVGTNLRYYKIHSKMLCVSYAGSCSDNRTHHICEECMEVIKEHIVDKARNKGT